MQRALDETERRRNKQLEFNVLHNITPRGITRGVLDIMEGARSSAPQPSGKRRGKDRGAATETGAAPVSLEPAAIARQIKVLETRMFAKAGSWNSRRRRRFAIRSRNSNRSSWGWRVKAPH